MGNELSELPSLNIGTLRDCKKAWTSGQWMTEKKGGSDVAGGCDTYAVQEKDNFVRFRIFSQGSDHFSQKFEKIFSVSFIRLQMVLFCNRC